MSERPLNFTQLVEQLDKHLAVISQAAHAPSPEAMENVLKSVGSQGRALVDVWRLLWTYIVDNEQRRQIAIDRMSRREPWSAERFPQLLGDILFSDRDLFQEVSRLLSTGQPDESTWQKAEAFWKARGIDIPEDTRGRLREKLALLESEVALQETELSHERSPEPVDPESTSVDAQDETDQRLESLNQSLSPDSVAYTNSDARTDTTLKLLEIASSRVLPYLIAMNGDNESRRSEATTSIDEPWKTGRRVWESLMPRLSKSRRVEIRRFLERDVSENDFTNILISMLPRSAALWTELATAVGFPVPAIWPDADKHEVDTRPWAVETRRTLELMIDFAAALHAFESFGRWRSSFSDEWWMSRSETERQRAKASFEIRGLLVRNIPIDEREDIRQFLLSQTPREILRFGSVLNLRVFEEPGFRASITEMLLKLGIFREVESSALGAVAVDASDVLRGPYRMPAVRPDTTDGLDLLGVDDYAKAFAMLIASTKLEPPVSVGIFGEWGWGKTYFMRRIRAYVEAISGAARESKLPQAELGVFQYIAQVEFNAWHYREGNLWASLVEHIFSNLVIAQGEPVDEKEQRRDELLRKIADQDSALEGIQQRVKEAEKEVETRKEGYDRASEEVAKRTEQVSRWRALDAVEIIARDLKANTSIQTQTNELLDEIGVAASGETLADLRSAIRTGRETMRTTGRVLAPLLKAKDRQRRLVLLLVALAIPVAVSAGLALLLANTRLQHITTSLSSLAWIGTMAGSAALWVRSQLAWASGWLGKAHSVVSEMDVKIFERQRQNAAGQAEAAGDLAKAEAECSKAELELVEAERYANNLKGELAEAEHGLTPAARLSDFLRDRMETNDYRKHLGVLAVIRRDFDKLSGLIERANHRLLDSSVVAESHSRGAPSGDLKPPFLNRIVLYIDDLDRCTSDQVVAVLQAVHLLLAFKLFVVVVGVDGRWVARALACEYRGLLAGRDSALDEIVATPPAAPRDYLEKIFQIPFRIPSIDEDNARKYIEGLLGESPKGSIQTPDSRLADTSLGMADSVSEPQSKISESQASSAQVSERDHVSPSGLPEAVPLQPTQPSAFSEADSYQVANATVAAPQRNADRFDLNPLALEITRSEIDVMKELAGLVGRSPRVIKSFVNVYQVLKSTVPAVEQPAFASETWGVGDFQIVLFLLAVMIGTPGVWRGFLERLIKDVELVSLRDALDQGTSVVRGPADFRIIAYLETGGQKLVDLPLSRIRLWAFRVARFSFGPGLD